MNGGGGAHRVVSFTQPVPGINWNKREAPMLSYVDGVLCVGLVEVARPEVTRACAAVRPTPTHTNDGRDADGFPSVEKPCTGPMNK